jgi:hypothetical protein
MWMMVDNMNNLILQNIIKINFHKSTAIVIVALDLKKNY